MSASATLTLTPELMKLLVGTANIARTYANDSTLFIGNLGAPNIAAGANGLIAIGQGAGVSAVTCSDSVYIGWECGNKATAGVGNTGVGRLVLSEVLTAGNNSAFGDSALAKTTTEGSSAFGYNSLGKATTGQENNSFARGALYNLLTGSYNCAFGSGSNGTGTALLRCCTFGYQSAPVNTGNDLCGFGYLAFGQATTGPASISENCGFGNNVGFTITTGYRNTFMGDSCGNHPSQLATAVDSTAIGRYSYTTKNNQVRLGSDSTVETVLNGDVIFKSLLTSVTPANNNELVIERTSNTTVTIKLKGTDGTVRSHALAMA